MRFSMIDLQCEDIMWFGIDSNKCILAFTSGGCGSVPEFVCRSKEETNQLELFFLEKLDELSDAEMEIPDDDTPLSMDAQLLAKKGVFVYDVSFEENHPDEYARIAIPTVPIHIDDLPADIAAIIRDHMIECDASCSKFLKIQHAY